MNTYILALCIYSCALASGDLDVKSEPQCWSRFDYEFKLVQKLAEVEIQQKQLEKLIKDMQATKRECSNYHTAFSAQLRVNTANLVLGSTVIFDDVTLNIGNNYDTYHGVFTATHKGLYFFTMTLSSPTHAYLWLIKNGVSYEFTFIVGDYWTTGTASITLQLDPGDRVWVEGRGVIYGYDGRVSSSATVSRTHYHTSFTGFLITTL